jgi:hypothetical protein
MRSATPGIWYALVHSLPCGHSACGYGVSLSSLVASMQFIADCQDPQGQSLSWDSSHGSAAVPYVFEESKRCAVGMKIVSLAGSRSRRRFA